MEQVSQLSNAVCVTKHGSGDHAKTSQTPQMQRLLGNRSVENCILRLHLPVHVVESCTKTQVILVTAQSSEDPGGSKTHVFWRSQRVGWRWGWGCHYNKALRTQAQPGHTPAHASTHAGQWIATILER
jgi:hypothetical protein